MLTTVIHNPVFATCLHYIENSSWPRVMAQWLKCYKWASGIKSLKATENQTEWHTSLFPVL